VSGSEKQLLENALDALDRLFDGQSPVIDVWALLFATAEALRATKHCSAFEAVVPALLDLVRSSATAEEQRDRALWLTDELRQYVAGLLPVG